VVQEELVVREVSEEMDLREVLRMRELREVLEECRVLGVKLTREVL
jgi:hypothetical protein